MNLPDTMRAALIWGALGLALGAPIAAAAFSPLLAWREPIYVTAGFAGILALAIMVIQPLLVAGLLPGFPALRGRRLHKWLGIALLSAVLLHVGGLWITSPPDVIDALLLVSPTPFSLWGVIAMWALFAAACFALLRRRLRLRWAVWRTGHVTLVAVALGGTVLHALLIQGTMETITKVALCVVAMAVLIKAMFQLRARRRGSRSTT